MLLRMWRLLPARHRPLRRRGASPSVLLLLPCCCCCCRHRSCTGGAGARARGEGRRRRPDPCYCCYLRSCRARSCGCCGKTRPPPPALFGPLWFGVLFGLVGAVNARWARVGFGSWHLCIYTCICACRLSKQEVVGSLSRGRGRTGGEARPTNKRDHATGTRSRRRAQSICYYGWRIVNDGELGADVSVCVRPSRSELRRFAGLLFAARSRALSLSVDAHIIEKSFRRRLAFFVSRDVETDSDKSAPHSNPPPPSRPTAIRLDRWDSDPSP